MDQVANAARRSTRDVSMSTGGKQDNMIRVSDITQYLVCPRQVYFTAHGHQLEEDRGKLLRREILKRVSCELPEMMQESEDVSSVLPGLLADVMQKIIQERGFSEELDETRTDEMQREILSAITSLLGSEERKRIIMNSRRSGQAVTSYKGRSEEQGEMMKGASSKTLMRSEKHGLKGRVDKTLKDKTGVSPVIIKSGECPERGVWNNDRIQLAAYALLMEEELHAPVDTGYVEYLMQGTIRKIRIKPYDKRMTLQVARRVRKILDGRLPDKVANAPCDICSFKDMCETRRSLLSRFF